MECQQGSNLGRLLGSFLASKVPWLQDSKGSLSHSAMGQSADNEALLSVLLVILNQAMDTESDEIVLGHLKPVLALQFVSRILDCPELLLSEGVRVVLVGRLIDVEERTVTRRGSINDVLFPWFQGTFLPCFLGWKVGWFLG
jgi:hypothetical protein